MMDDDIVDDDIVEISRQFGVFLRRADRFYCELKDGQGLGLERAAYSLLTRIVTGGPGRLSVLAEDQGLDLSTVSRQVATLEAAGLVARTTDSADRRASVITATETGVEVFARNRAIWHAALHDLLSDWTPGERAEFARLFASFNEKIAAQASRGMRQEITR
jgi:DNA-binding MarR family transcriptional regulator